MVNENPVPRTFEEVVAYAVGNSELVKEFNRLSGCNLGQSAQRTGLDRLIDESTGYSGETDDDMAKFAAFVWEFVWCRLPREEVD
jgi:hypothetical protein